MIVTDGGLSSISRPVMQSFPRCRVGHLFLFLLIGGGGTVAASSIHEPASAQQLAMSDIPVEVRDHIFSSVGIVEYAAYLEASKSTTLMAASGYLELQILHRAAEEFEALDFEVLCQRGRKRAILSALHIVIRTRSQRPIVHVEEDLTDANLKESVARLENVFTLCAPLSPSPLWRETCMMGLLGGGVLQRILSKLSPGFKAANMSSLVFAILASGDLAALEILCQDHGKLILLHSPATPLGIALNGSFGLLLEMIKKTPKLIEVLAGIIVWASAFNRDKLARAGTSLFRIAVGPSSNSKSVGAIFSILCKVGQVDVIKDFWCLFADRLSLGKLRRGMKEAASGGNLPIIRCYMTNAWNPLEESKPPLWLLNKMLRSAVRNNCLNVLEYLLLDWPHECRLELRQYVPAVLAKAAEYGHLEAMDFLLGRDREGAHLVPNLAIGGQDNDLLLAAVDSGSAKVLAYLMERKGRQGVDADSRFERLDLASEQNCALRRACQKNLWDIVEYLLQMNENHELVHAGIDPGVHNNFPLYKACLEGHFAIVKKLLTTDEKGDLVYPGVRPDARNNSPLLIAAANGHIDIVRLLLEQRRDKEGELRYRFPGIDPTADTQYAVMNAIAAGHVDVVALLLQRDTRGRLIHQGVQPLPGSLVQAVQVPDPRLVEILLAASLPHRKREIWLALTEAELWNKGSAIKLLREALQEHIDGLQGDIRDRLNVSRSGRGDRL